MVALSPNDGSCSLVRLRYFTCLLCFFCSSPCWDVLEWIWRSQIGQCSRPWQGRHQLSSPTLSSSSLPSSIGRERETREMLFLSLFLSCVTLLSSRTKHRCRRSPNTFISNFPIAPLSQLFLKVLARPRLPFQHHAQLQGTLRRKTSC